MSSLSGERKKINLFQAAADLEKLCEAIDNLDDIGPLVKALFDESKDTLEESIDRRISYLHHLENSEEGAKKMAALWQKRSSVLANARQRILDHTSDVLRTLPNFRYKGTLGELRLQANGGKKPMVLKGEFEKLAGGFIPEGAAGLGALDKKFLQSGYKIDEAAIRDRLEAGEKLEFAELKERGKHVRIAAV